MATGAQWTCSYCTFINPGVNLNCEGCFETKESSLAALQHPRVFDDGDYEKDYAGQQRRENGRRRTGTGLSLFSRIKRYFTTPRAPPPPKRWTCDNCTYSNNDILVKCEMCGRERPRRRRMFPWSGSVRRTWSPPTATGSTPTKQRSTVSTETSQWACPYCQFLNHGSLPRCEMCSKDSPRVANGQSQADMPFNPGHRVTSIYDDHPSTVADVEDFVYVPSLPVSDTQLDSPTQLVTGELGFGRSLSVRERRMNDEEEAAVQQNAILLYCQTNHEPFVDPDFRPDNSALFMKGGVSVGREWKVQDWQRPPGIRDPDQNSSPWTVFRTPRPSDIHQGALGNCWILSALAVMAESPEMIENIVVTKQYSPEGVYQVRLCKDGRWVVVTVDDLFPCKSDGTLVFSQARRKQLWVPLIEKSIAKLFGSYEALHSGTIQEGLSLLTGVACEEVEIAVRGEDADSVAELEIIWARLLSFKDAGFLTAAACGMRDVDDDSQDQLFRAVGLLPSHAYSVLDVRLIPLDQRKALRLIRLRNPWGRYSWTGAWSDSSHNWEDFPALREELMPCGAVEGIFWMEWNDFLRYFYRIVVCKYRPHWFCESIQGQLMPLEKLQSMSLEVMTPTEVDICLYQTSTRGNGVADLWNLWTLVLKCPPPPDAKGSSAFTHPTAHTFHSICTSQASVSCSGWLEAGFYVAIPFSFIALQDNNQESSPATRQSPVTKDLHRSKDYFLSVFSSRPLILDKLHLRPGFAAQAIYLLAKKVGRKIEPTKFLTIYHMNIPRMCRMTVAENRTNAHCIVTTDASDSYNIVSTREELQTVDCIPPGHWQVLWVFSRPVETSAYTITLKMDYQLTPKNLEGGWGAVHLPPYPAHLQEIHQVYPI